MCLRIFLIGLIATTLVCSFILAQSPFYYGSDGPITLGIDSTKVQIKFAEDSMSPQSIDEIDRIIAIVDSNILTNQFLLCSLSTSQGFTEFLDSLRSVDYIYLAEPLYTIGDTFVFPVGQSFVSAFSPSVLPATIDSINSSLHVLIERELEAFDNVYLLQNTDSTNMGVLDLANLYHNLEIVEFAHPDFNAKPEPCSYKTYDFYGDYQWQLQKSIQHYGTKTVWDFAGLNRPIVVAVIDSRVEAHEDLPAERILPEYDIFGEDGTNLEDPVHGHGMSVAGIIGASHTTDSLAGEERSSGIFSISPNVHILPIRVLDDSLKGTSSVKVAEAIAWAYQNGANVINCSWGYPYPGSDFPIVNRALYANYRFGRNGLGTPIFFASGNNREIWQNTVGYPANLDFCFSVGAVTEEDTLFYYSMYGPELDAVAPSGCFGIKYWSLDLMDSAGYNGRNIHYPMNCPSSEENDLNYNCNFTGTSGACPIAAGIASLLLSRDSTLTADQIYDILRYSAVTEMESGAIEAPDSLYGYGRLNAFWAMLSICRGDANNDGEVNTADAVYIINFAFKSGPLPEPIYLTGDANCDGFPDMGDAVYIINYVYKNGPPPGICYKMLP